MGVTSSRFSLAVHILALITIEQKDEPTTSEYLARSAKTNPVVIRRILAMLGKAGLVVAQPGTSGGVKLAQSVENINLQQIYKAVESRALFSFGSREYNPYCICGRSLEPVMKNIFHQAETALEETLAAVTLAQVAKDVKAADLQSHSQ